MKPHAPLLSIYGCNALEVPVALAEVEGAEPGGSLEVLVALIEVEGVELGRVLAAVFMSGGVQATSSSGQSSIWSSRKCNS